MTNFTGAISGELEHRRVETSSGWIRIGEVTLLRPRTAHIFAGMEKVRSSLIHWFAPRWTRSSCRIVRRRYFSLLVATTLLLAGFSISVAEPSEIGGMVSRCQMFHENTDYTVTPTLIRKGIRPRGNLSGRLMNPQKRAGNARIKIVAIGDSAVWGNGLRVENKYLSKLSQSLADETGRAVDLVSYAHSGALLSYSPATTQVHTGPVEVPPADLNAGIPTIAEQEVCAASIEESEDTKADLVILNGCINDVGALRIGLPFPFSDMDTDELRARIQEKCAIPMRDLVIRARQDFPFATIVIANYWLIISDESSVSLAETKQRADLNSRRKAVDRLYKKQLDLRSKSDDSSGKKVPLSAYKFRDAFQAWSANSRAFLLSTTKCFERAIDEQRNMAGCATEADTIPLDCNDTTPYPVVDPSIRVYLAKVSSCPEYSYGASSSRVWRLAWLWGRDEVYSKRARLCCSHYQNGPIDEQLVCYINPTAHPNIAGAEAYHRSIMDIVRRAWATGS